MKDYIESAIAAICKDLFGADVRIELSRPDEQFGDFSTNVAMQLAKKSNKNPREVAEQIIENVRTHLGPKISNITIAGPGFINFRLSDSGLTELAKSKPARSYEGKQVVSEYSDPSAFKVLHAGHLYTSVVGDAISNLLENAGGNVHRVNFGGDVGRHVAITMWAIVKELGGERPEKLIDIPQDKHADWMSARYVQGNTAFEDDEQIQSEVTELNKRVYQIFSDDDHESPFAQIYWTCRQWSYDYFDAFYARIGSHFEKYYPESETAPIGLAVVREQLSKGVYKESDGAVVFEGEKYGLHTRVFINSQGLPTYEAKDVGLIMKKWDDYHFDKSLILTDNAQGDYLTVVMKSIEQFAPELANATTHLTHGRVKLAGGEKMSSRKGNIVRAVDVLDIAAEVYRSTMGRDDEQAVLGAVKYAFLKQRLGADIIYDPKESVSLEGNSGPYIQYAHARARSILAKATNSRHSGLDPESSEKGIARSDSTSELDSSPRWNGANVQLDAGERSLLRKISEYAEVVDKSTSEFLPHHICTYLYELAQEFNRFYEHNRVIGDERQSVRLQLVVQYADILKNGLGLLGIAAPDKM